MLKKIKSWFAEGKNDAADNQIAKAAQTPAEQQDSNTIEVTEYSVRFIYDWIEDLPINEKTPCNRFCEKLMQLTKDGRTWSTKDIVDIGKRMGYEVLYKCGAEVDDGEVDENGNPVKYNYIKDGVVMEHCKHQWKAVVVTKKK